MKYMVNELDQCDSIRAAYNELVIEHEYTMDHGDSMIEYYEDTLEKLSNAYEYQVNFSDIQTYNANNAEQQLNNCTRFRKERNAWRIIAGVAIIVGTIININHE